MKTDAYIKRLSADLEQWVRKGFIDEATAKTLREHAGATPPSTSSSPILTSLAGLVIGLGVLTVIAANWSATPQGTLDALSRTSGRLSAHRQRRRRGDTTTGGFFESDA